MIGNMKEVNGIAFEENEEQGRKTKPLIASTIPHSHVGINFEPLFLNTCLIIPGSVKLNLIQTLKRR